MVSIKTIALNMHTDITIVSHALSHMSKTYTENGRQKNDGQIKANTRKKCTS